MIRHLLVGMCIAIASSSFAFSETRIVLFTPFIIFGDPVEDSTAYVRGHALFCSETLLCRTHGPPKERLTSDRWQELKDTNVNVNRSFEQRVEPEGREAWRFMAHGVTYGDCEDFAITKREWLIALGWSPRALLIAVVRDVRGDLHALLIARTDRGDYALDMQYDEVMLWHQNPAQEWISITDPYKFSQWRRIAGGAVCRNCS